VICPSFLAQKYFQKNLRPGKKVYLLGPKCLRDELEAVYVSVLSDDRSFKLPDFDELEKINIDEDVSHVLVSFDRDITLDKIVKAAEYVKNGATFLATNLDSVLHLKENVHQQLFELKISRDNCGSKGATGFKSIEFSSGQFCGHFVTTETRKMS